MPTFISFKVSLKNRDNGKRKQLNIMTELEERQ
jgi:hypothetical protein